MKNPNSLEQPKTEPGVACSAWLGCDPITMMDDMRQNGWLVVLKCVPPNKEFFTGDTGGEYDAGEKFRAIRDGQWVCTAEWMMRDLYRPSVWKAAPTPGEAVQYVWNFTKGISQPERNDCNQSGPPPFAAAHG